MIVWFEVYVGYGLNVPHCISLFLLWFRRTGVVYWAVANFLSVLCAQLSTDPSGTSWKPATFAEKIAHCRIHELCATATLSDWHLGFEEVNRCVSRNPSITNGWCCWSYKMAWSRQMTPHLRKELSCSIEFWENWIPRPELHPESLNTTIFVWQE